MESILVPHPEIPNHFTIKQNYHLVTSDCKKPTFKWSRLIRKNYIHKHGFLGHLGIERIDIRLFYAPPNGDDVKQVDHSQLADELQSLISEDTEAILHYSGLGEVICVITGVKPTMLSELSEQYSRNYYENCNENH